MQLHVIRITGEYNNNSGSRIDSCGTPQYKKYKHSVCKFIAGGITKVSSCNLLTSLQLYIVVESHYVFFFLNTS